MKIGKLELGPPDEHGAREVVNKSPARTTPTVIERLRRDAERAKQRNASNLRERARQFCKGVRQNCDTAAGQGCGGCDCVFTYDPKAGIDQAMAVAFIGEFLADYYPEVTQPDDEVEHVLNVSIRWDTQ